MARETVIRLICEDRDDGAFVYMASPDIPLLHIVAPKEKARETILNVIKDHFLLNHKMEVKLRIADDLESFLRGEDAAEWCPEAHVIAQVADNHIQ